MDDFNLTNYFSNSTAITNSTVASNIYLVVFGWITFCIELPVICWAILSLCHLVKTDQVTPVYVINLFISDILQLLGRLGDLIECFLDGESYITLIILIILKLILLLGILASVVFMVCIALERYLLIVHPLWYRYRRTVRRSVLVSLAAWVSPFIVIICYISVPYGGLAIVIVFSLPFPLLMFFLVVTWRALSHSTSVPVAEKRRILGMLFLVLSNYAVLFFPTIFIFFIASNKR
ncbi:free fatty acid receptor 3-like [Megalops cyprinoides]|uniref:free fatty acid receptor 3-like n=1 Tax=Megalops cyprinoides TaxID=118141 RepID=UPI001863FA82|nr:free fatty acid receptor 3-like [Megalops cyprinoides]